MSMHVLLFYTFYPGDKINMHQSYNKRRQRDAYLGNKRMSMHVLLFYTFYPGDKINMQHVIDSIAMSNMILN